MDDYRSSVKQAGIRALAYGFALMVGDLIAFGLFRLLPMNYLRGLESEIDILLTGIALALAIVAIGGGFGGFIGGWTLPIVGGEKKQHSYAWRSAISMGLLYSPIVFLGLFMVSIFAYYYVNITPASVFMLIFLIIGALFRLLFGLLFGLLTLGWRGSGWVVLASVIGFGVGGLGLGLRIVGLPAIRSKW